MRRKTPKFTLELGFEAGKNKAQRAPGFYPQPPVVINEGATKTLRLDQELACRALMGALRFILNQPTASGKTLIMMVLCWLYLKVNPTGLVIIAVPQTQIGEGFRSSTFNVPGEQELVNWAPVNYLLGGSQPEKTRKLLSLLKGRRHPDPMQRTIVCSHLTLLLTVKQAFAESPKLFRNLALVIDEAHHCRVDADSGDAEVAGLLPDRTNALGRLVELGIKEPKRNLSVWLATATFFRGDTRGIVGEHRDNFITHKMDYTDFFDQCCRYLKRLTYNFALYQDVWSDVIDEAWRVNPNAHMIVYIPYVQSECAHPDGKAQDVMSVWCGVSGKQTPVTKQDGPVTLVRRGNKWLKFVDLVDITDREAKKQYIEQAHLGAVELDGIVCLGMFKEGSNWRQADTAVIVGPRNSLTENVQMIGRLLRDYEGKESVVVYHCLPEDQENQGEQYRLGRIKAICAAMVLEELYCPIKVVGRKGGSHEVSTSRLLDLAGDDLGVVSAVKQDIIEQMVLRNNPDVLYPKDLLKTITAEVLKEKFDTEDPDDIWLVSEQMRRSMVKRHRDRARLELMTNTDEVDAELFHKDLLSFGIDAAGLRRWHAILLDRRENWFTRFWSHLLEYLFGQHGYALKCGLDTLGNHPPEEPVELTCPQGHEYSVAPQDFACGARCPRCGGETNKPPFYSSEPTKLQAPNAYVSPDGYRLGRVLEGIRNGNNSVNSEYKIWLSSVGLAFLNQPRVITKHTVLALLNANGYTVNSIEDTGSYSRAKIGCTCPEGHRWTTTYSSFKSGYRCLTCGGKKQYTEEEVAAAFTAEGYSADLSHYTNSNAKCITATCPCGHTFDTGYSHFKSGARCPVCAGVAKHSKEEIQTAFANEGYTVTVPVSANTKTMLRAVCPNGHTWTTNYNRFMSNHYRCPQCSGHAKKEVESVREMFVAEKYSVDMSTYTNVMSRIVAYCPHGHKWETSASKFNSGYRCQECSGNRKKTKEEINTMFTLSGYKVDLSGYNNVYSRVQAVCPSGHLYDVVVREFGRGKRCPQCRRHKNNVSQN